MSGGGPPLICSRTIRLGRHGLRDHTAENQWWWGWKYIEQNSTCEEFLIRVAQSPEVVEEIAEMFRKYVQQAYELVIQANKALASLK